MPRVIAIWQGGSGPPQRRDEYVPVLALIHQRGMLNRPILTPVCADRDQADWIRKGLYLSARYYCSCGEKYCTRKHNNIDGCPNAGVRLSCRADVVKDAKGRLRVQVRLWDKQIGIRSVVERYGPDPSQWPYQSKARKLKEASNGAV